MPPCTARPTLRSLAAVALLALFGTTASLAQDEPALVSPASQTPKVATVAPAADRQVTRQRPVEIDMRPLADKSTRGGTSFRIELFDGHTVVVDTVRVEHRSATNYTYFGKVRGQPASEVVLTYVDGHLSADIALGVERAADKSYRIRSLPDAGHWLQEVNPDAFPPDHPGGAEGLPAPRLDKLTQGRATKLLQFGEADDLELDSGTTVDLLVVYSNQTATAAGAAIGSQIQSAIDRANLAYANSGISFRLRLVHSASFGYSESGNFSTDLSNLAGSATVAGLRNTYGADMVNMFIENGAYCGVAYIGPSAGSAFSVVNRGCAGSNLSLAHELGHNFGARHDPYVDASTTPYAYGHGYTYPAGGWRTVMAYNNACSAAGTSCTRITYFSGPTVTYGGVAAGTVATHDNKRVHNGNAYTVANFRQATGGGCTYALAPTSASVAVAGASGSTTVTAGAGCAWNATSGASWLAIGAGSGTSGNGTLNYTATANTGPARNASITVGGVPFAVSQASGCTYTVSPTSASFGAGATTASVTVTTTAGCTWTASSGASWASITAGASGSGNGTVTYAVSANTGTLRTGNLTVAGRTVTLSQSAGCTYAVSPTSASVVAGGGSGATTVTAGTSCAWNATSSAAWLTIGAGSGTSGNGTLNFIAAANPGVARSATLRVGGATFTVNQAGACTYALSPTSASVAAAGASGSTAVTATAGCAWNATSSASWLTIGAGSGTSGNGTLNYTAAANAGAARSATITVGGVAFTVAQASGCTYAFSPTSASVGTSGGSGSTTVTAGAGCAWNTTSSAAWLTVGAGSGTSGSGTLNYTATANTGPARSATLTVGGRTFTVSQSNGCTYTVTPTTATIGSTGGNASVTVSTSAGCTWGATSAVTWMTVGLGGTGSGTLSYTVSSNTGAQRTGTLTVAGRSVSVTQSAGSITPVASASLNPTGMDFGNQEVGTTGNVLAGNYTNTGNVALTISGIALGGNNPADFVARNVCVVGQTLQPGATCAVGYAFAPKNNGNRSAIATVTSNAGTKSLSLSGNGKNSRGKP